MKKKVILMLFVLVSSVIIAQSKDAPRRKTNGIFFEFFGNGLYYSVNYEKQFSNDTIFRVGCSYIFDGGSVTMTMGKLFGERRAKLELGLGMTLLDSKELWGGDLESFYLSGVIALRIQFPTAPFFIRIGLTPFLSPNKIGKEGWFMPWAGASIGYTF